MPLDSNTERGMRQGRAGTRGRPAVFPLTGREQESERQKGVCGCTGGCTCNAEQLNMHDAEGIKSTPRTADGLCRRVTINVHRPNIPPGAPGENKPEKVDLYKRANPQQTCIQRESSRGKMVHLAVRRRRPRRTRALGGGGTGRRAGRCGGGRCGKRGAAQAAEPGGGKLAATSARRRAEDRAYRHGARNRE